MNERAGLGRLLTLSLVAIALAVLVARQPEPALATIDFRVLIQQHFNLLDRGDVAGVMATFSDDAVVSGASCRPTPCVGKPAIQREIERRVNNRAVQTLTSLQESSGRGVGMLVITEDLTRACNVERIIVLCEVEVKNDKITLFASQPDTTDAATAAFVACQAAGPAPALAPAISPPRTGDGGLVQAGS